MVVFFQDVIGIFGYRIPIDCFESARFLGPESGTARNLLNLPGSVRQLCLYAVHHFGKILSRVQNCANHGEIVLVWHIIGNRVASPQGVASPLGSLN